MCLSRKIRYDTSIGQRPCRHRMITTASRTNTTKITQLFHDADYPLNVTAHDEKKTKGKLSIRQNKKCRNLCSPNNCCVPFRRQRTFLLRMNECTWSVVRRFNHWNVGGWHGRAVERPCIKRDETPTHKGGYSPVHYLLRQWFDWRLLVLGFL